MSYQALAYEKNGLVGRIRMPDVDSRATLARLSDELTELCDEIRWDETVRVVLLSGTREGSFSIKTFPSEDYESIGGLIADPVAGLDRPVIAALNGDAIGQGLELALACDIRIAAETSHFALPHVHRGLIPWDGGTQRLARVLGRSKALEMILTGETIDAREALRIGLLSRILPAEEVMPAAMKTAETVASMAPVAVRYVKEAVSRGMEMPLEQGLSLEGDLYLLLYTTRDRVEGIQAFREKRPPRFEGR